MDFTTLIASLLYIGWPSPFHNPWLRCVPGMISAKNHNRKVLAKVIQPGQMTLARGLGVRIGYFSWFFGRPQPTIYRRWDWGGVYWWVMSYRSWTRLQGVVADRQLIPIPISACRLCVFFARYRDKLYVVFCLHKPQLTIYPYIWQKIHNWQADIGIEISCPSASRANREV